MNEADAAANSRAVDSLLNYETVKYFNNEGYEADRLKADLKRAEDASVQSEISLAWLNAGQSFIIAIGVTAMMALAAQGVADKTMTLGDLVLVNAYLIQLFIPLNFLGTVYREIRNALADMEKLFDLLHKPPEIVDAADARRCAPSPAMCASSMSASPTTRAGRSCTKSASTIPAGRKLAVVGASGAGKSTLSRSVVPLLRRHRRHAFASTARTSATPHPGQPARRHRHGAAGHGAVQRHLYHNIAYGRPDASREEVEEAARLAHLDRLHRQSAGRLRPRSASAA
jgi:ABC-type transport system involved in Fe-S cluster assembly fused permease/ATPase subunit